MKLRTKFISLVLAVVLVLSCFTCLAFVTTSAATQTVYFEFPSDGTWGDPTAISVTKTGLASVYCNVYAIYGNTTELASRAWQTSKTRCTSLGNNLYSVDVAAMWGNIDDNADYGIQFSTKKTDNTTYATTSLTFSSECIGDTIKITDGTTRENPMNSQEQQYMAAWENHSDEYGPICSITSLGAYADGYAPKYQPKAQMLSNALNDYLLNSINAGYFQLNNNLSLCNSLGVTPQEVYNQYMADKSEIIAAGEVTTSTVKINGVDTEVEVVTYGSTTIPGPTYVRNVLGVTDTPDPTEAPTTVPPTTVAPTTVKPTTAPVVTTVKPTTVPVTTVKPTTVPATTVAYEELAKGDVDKNGTVNINDATLLQKYIAKIVALDSNQLRVADGNEDGYVNIIDVTWIQRYVAQLEDVDTLLVNAKSNFFPSAVAQYGDPVNKWVEVQYNIDTAGKKIMNAQFEIQYDPDVLAVSAENFDSMDEYLIAPFASESNSAMIVNDTTPGSLVVNFLNVNGAGFESADLTPAFADIIFDIGAIPESGMTEVNLNLTMISFANEGSETDVDSWIVADSYQDDFSSVISYLKNETTTETELYSNAAEVDVDPTLRSVYTVAGTANLVATAWSELFETETVMTKQGDVYVYTFHDVEPDTDLFQVKILEWPNGDNTQYVWHGISGTNLNYDFMVVETTDVTVTFNPATEEINVTGDGVREAEININYLVAAGNGEDTWLNGLNWDQTASANRMTEVSDDVYEIMFEELPDFDNWQVKFAANGSWAINWGGVVDQTKTVETDTSVTYTGDGEYNADMTHNITFETPFASNTVVLRLDLTNFNPTTKQGAVFTVTVTDETA